MTRKNCSSFLSSLGTHGAMCTQVTLEPFDCFHSDSFMWVCFSIPSPHDKNHAGLNSPSSVPEISFGSTRDTQNHEQIRVERAGKNKELNSTSCNLEIWPIRFVIVLYIYKKNYKLHKWLLLHRSVWKINTCMKKVYCFF